MVRMIDGRKRASAAFAVQRVNLGPARARVCVYTPCVRNPRLARVRESAANRIYILVSSYRERERELRTYVCVWIYPSADASLALRISLEWCVIWSRDCGVRGGLLLLDVEINLRLLWREARLSEFCWVRGIDERELLKSDWCGIVMTSAGETIIYVGERCALVN